MTPSRVKGIPNLLVEILSPSNAEYDLVTKRECYLAHRVPLYWIVDPEEHLVHVLTLVDNAYHSSIETNRLTLDLPPLVDIDLATIWYSVCTPDADKDLK